MKNSIHIHLGYYFPATFIFLGVIMFFMGVALLLNYPLVSIVLLLVSLFLFTTRYQCIECLFITKNRYSQTINSRISSMTRHSVEYNGYIEFDVDKEHIISHDNKAKVMQKLNKISKKLSGDVILSTDISINGEIIDYSEDQSL